MVLFVFRFRVIVIRPYVITAIFCSAKTGIGEYFIRWKEMSFGGNTGVSPCIPFTRSRTSKNTTLQRTRTQARRADVCYKNLLLHGNAVRQTPSGVRVYQFKKKNTHTCTLCVSCVYGYRRDKKKTQVGQGYGLLITRVRASHTYVKK